MNTIEKLRESVINFQIKEVPELTKKALEEGHNALEILNEGLIKAMEVVGEKYEKQEYFLPELLAAAQSMYASLDILKPLLAKSGKIEKVGKVVLGTVKGDLHDIGKNILKMMFEGANFEVIDLGRDVPAEKFVEAVEKEHPQFIGMSALLTTTMLQMKEVIEKLKENGLRDKVKIMVGGAPVTEEYAKEIGADIYADNASEAVRIAKGLVKISG
ncbi:MAG TPA: cobalamin-binding protein [Thermotogaceae bacterium]|nr:corrinoid protein [Thermotogota bacterium]HEW91283.1 cobalamin-binding protein [Thermotogaceae bacterium]